MQAKATSPFDGPLALEDLSVRPARSRLELESAYARVYWGYLERAYIPAHPSQMRFSIFNALPTTVTFVSVLRDEVIASVTLVSDTEIGLPMDEIYGDELQALRDAGRKLTEATMFADRRQRDFRRVVPMLLLLMKRVFDYATLILEANDLCITINPHHESFYERTLLFEPVGELKAYPSVLDNPALAKRLNLETVREKCKEKEKLWQRFFENRTPREVFENRYQMMCDDLHFFFVETVPVFRDASPEQLECLQKHYPQCPWEQWKAKWQQ